MEERLIRLIGIERSKYSIGVLCLFLRDTYQIFERRCLLSHASPCESTTPETSSQSPGPINQIEAEIDPPNPKPEPAPTRQIATEETNDQL